MLIALLAQGNLNKEGGTRWIKDNSLEFCFPLLCPVKNGSGGEGGPPPPAGSCPLPTWAGAWAEGQHLLGDDCLQGDFLA